MSDEKQDKPPLRSFNAQALLDNVGQMRLLIQRIRQKDGGVGSQEDELTLHRAIHDLDLLVDIVDGLKASCSRLQEEAKNHAAIIEQQRTQLVSLKQVYEKMIAERNDKIKELEGDSTT